MNLIYPTAQECLKAAIDQHHCDSGWKTVDDMIWATQIPTPDGMAWKLGANTHHSEQLLQPLGLLGSLFASRGHMEKVVSEVIDVDWRWERPQEVFSITNQTMMVGHSGHWRLRSWGKDKIALRLDDHPTFTTRKALIDFVYDRISVTQMSVRTR